MAMWNHKATKTKLKIMPVKETAGKWEGNWGYDTNVGFDVGILHEINPFIPVRNRNILLYSFISFLFIFLYVLKTFSVLKLVWKFFLQLKYLIYTVE